MTVSLQLIGASGRIVGTVELEEPLALSLDDGLELMQKLDQAASNDPSYRDIAPSPQVAEDDVDAAGAEWVNYRTRAEALDLPRLYAWLQRLDPSNPHMQIAYEVVTDRIAEVEGAVASVEIEPQSISADVQESIDAARRLETEWRTQRDLADAGDEAAQLKANDLRAQLVALRQDIADGVDRIATSEGEL